MDIGRCSILVFEEIENELKHGFSFKNKNVEKGFGYLL